MPQTSLPHRHKKIGLIQMKEIVQRSRSNRIIWSHHASTVLLLRPVKCNANVSDTVAHDYTTGKYFSLMFVKDVCDDK